MRFWELGAWTLLGLVLASGAMRPASAAPAPGSVISGLRDQLEVGDPLRMAAVEAQALELLARAECATRDDSLARSDLLEIVVEARLRTGRGALAGTDTLASRLLHLREALLDPLAPGIVTALRDVALLEKDRRDYGAAIAHLERALGILGRRGRGSEAMIAALQSNLASVHFLRGEHGAAAALLERTRALQDRPGQPPPPQLANTLLALADARLASGDTAGVDACYRRAGAILDSTSGAPSAVRARALFREAAWRRRLGDLRAAAELLDRALAAPLAAAADPATHAGSLLERATVYRVQGSPDSARRLAERALRAYRILPGAGDDEAYCHLMIGDLDTEAARYDSARAEYDLAAALAAGQARPDSALLGNCLQARAALCAATGNFERAAALEERALALAVRRLGGEAAEVTAARIRYATRLTAASRFDSAAAEYHLVMSALSRRRESVNATTAEAWLGQGILARQRDDLPKARADLEKALDISERVYGPADPRVANCLIQLGIVHRQLGDPEGGRTRLDGALRILRQAAAPQRRRLAEALVTLASLDRADGRDSVAALRLREALDLESQELPPGHPDLAVPLRNMGSLENGAGAFEAAERHFARALEILIGSVGPDHPDVAATEIGLANALKGQGRLTEAMARYRHAIALHLAAFTPESPKLALDYYNLAGALLESGDVTAAMDTALLAERLSRDHFCMLVGGVTEGEALHLAATRVRGLDMILTCAAASNAPSDWARAWDVVIRSRALVLEEMAMRRRALADWQSPDVRQLDSSLAAARARLEGVLVRGRGRMPRDQYALQIQQARQEAQRLERALLDRSESRRAQAVLRAEGLASVQAALPPGDALVSWVRFDLLQEVHQGPGPPPARPRLRRGEPWYAVFSLEPGDSLPRFRLVARADSLDRLISAWLIACSSPPLGDDLGGADHGYAAAARALRSAAWDPVRRSSDRAGRVLMVPDGLLHLVNLATLTDSAGSYLVESGPGIHVLATERDLLPRPVSRRVGAGLLTLAAPDYDCSPALAGGGEGGRGPGLRGVACGQFRNLAFDSLPGTRAESERIVDLWHRFGSKLGAPSPGAGADAKAGAAVVRTGAGASERAFKTLAPACRTLHVATHGFFLDPQCNASAGSGTMGRELDEIAESGLTQANPLLLSGLAFAGANRREQALDPGNDGIVTAEEIVQMDLGGVDWAVLSACQTGLGRIRDGEGVFGMKRAFLIAGARSLILSLWSVDDAATAEWMTALFDERLREGRGAAEAVRAASLAVLRDRRARGASTHPFYWGAFTALGDWR